ncbi:hypothetical protein MPER_06956, partial [Moniliophthora perniciosa FA553]
QNAASKAKAQLIQREIAALYRSPPDPATIHTPPVHVLRGRPRPVLNRSIPSTTDQDELWKIYVASYQTGITQHRDLRAGWQAVSAVTEGNVALLLAQSQEDAERYWDGLVLAQDLSRSSMS